jgi:hypothetical protein
MTEALERAVVPPVSDADPFAHDVLLDPEPLHQALGEAGPVVYLSRYDVHALARYEQVHAALVDWQHFESGSGAGLANFRHEKPWRPPSLLLEADPPRHDAPRRVLREILAPPALRRLRQRWHALAEELVDQVLADGTEFDAFTALAEAFPLRAFPDAVGLGPDGRENLLPYGNMAFNAFGPRNDLVAADAHRVAELSKWVNAQCEREALSEDGFGARICRPSSAPPPPTSPSPTRSYPRTRRSSPRMSGSVPPPPPVRGRGSRSSRCRPARPSPARRRLVPAGTWLGSLTLMVDRRLVRQSAGRARAGTPMRAGCCWGGGAVCR